MFTPTKEELEELEFKFEQWKRIEWILKLEDHYKKDVVYGQYIVYSVPNNQFWLSDFDNNIKFPIQSIDDIKTLIRLLSPNN